MKDFFSQVKTNLWGGNSSVPVDKNNRDVLAKEVEEDNGEISPDSFDPENERHQNENKDEIPNMMYVDENKKV